VNAVALAEVEGHLIAEGLPSEMFGTLAATASPSAIADYIRANSQNFARILPALQLRAHRFGSSAEAQVKHKAKPRPLQPHLSLGQRVGIDTNGSVVMFANGGDPFGKDRQVVVPSCWPATRGDILISERMPDEMRFLHIPDYIWIHFLPEDYVAYVSLSDSQAGIRAIEEDAANVLKRFRGEIDRAFWKRWGTEKLVVKLQNGFSIEIVGRYQQSLSVKISFDLSTVSAESREGANSRVRRLLAGIGPIYQESNILSVTTSTEDLQDSSWLQRFLQQRQALFTFNPNAAEPDLAA